MRHAARRNAGNRPVRKPRTRPHSVRAANEAKRHKPHGQSRLRRRVVTQMTPANRRHRACRQSATPLRKRRQVPPGRVVTQKRIALTNGFASGPGVMSRCRVRSATRRATAVRPVAGRFSACVIVNVNG